MAIQVIEKDLLTVTPEFANGDVIIAHQVNCQGVMGSGVAAVIKSTFPRVYEEYAQLCATSKDSGLDLMGRVQVVNTSEPGKSNLYVANVFAQLGFGREKMQTEYWAVADAMTSLSDTFEHSWKTPPTLYVPYMMGSDRGGADWDAYSIILELAYTVGEVVACKLPTPDPKSKPVAERTFEDWSLLLDEYLDMDDGTVI